MRILFACHQFFPDHHTGTERYTLMLAKQLQALGHFVEVTTYACNGVEGLEPSPVAGILWKRHSYQRIPVTEWRHARYTDTGLAGVSSRIGDPLLDRALEAFLRDRAIDLVHVTHPMRQTPILRAARQCGAKIVLHLTDFWLLCPRGILLRPDDSPCEGPREGRACAAHCFGARQEDVLTDRYRRALAQIRMADLVIAPSHFLHGVFARQGIDTTRFIDRTYSFDHSVVQPVRGHHDERRARGEPLTFAFMGTLLPHKGVDVLIEAFRRVQHDGIRLRLYGRSFDHTEYDRLLRSLAAGDWRIERCGEYDFEEVGSIFREIDAVVVPSIWYENNPLVVGISHAACIPVIASDIGGVTGMIDDGVNGLTFARGNADDLARVLKRVADEPAVLGRLAERISPPPHVEEDALELEAMYQGLLDGSGVTVHDVPAHLEAPGGGVSAR